MPVCSNTIDIIIIDAVQQRIIDQSEFTRYTRLKSTCCTAIRCNIIGTLAKPKNKTLTLANSNVNESACNVGVLTACKHFKLNTQGNTS